MREIKVHHKCGRVLQCVSLVVNEVLRHELPLSLSLIELYFDDEMKEIHAIMFTNH